MLMLPQMKRWLMGSEVAKGGKCDSRDINGVHDLQYGLFTDIVEKMEAAQEKCELTLDIDYEIELRASSSAGKDMKKKGMQAALNDGTKKDSKTMATLQSPV
jgi:hypothetical protein